MSFVFSKITITPENPTMQPLVRYEGGFLDEYDVYDRMRRDPAYAGAAFTRDIWKRIRIEHYRYFSVEAKERPADGDHFSMMWAYDELAAQYGAKLFVERDEIQRIGLIECTVSHIRDQLYRRLI